MTSKPKTSAGYDLEQTALVRATCLYAATKLGDLMDDIVLVGGLVPSLLIAQDPAPEGVDPHVGTMELDIGLALALLDGARYEDVSERLRRAGFEQDVNERGNRTNHRWRVNDLATARVAVDFLIPPSQPSDRGGRLRNLEHDFAAVILPGLSLAFQDRKRVPLEGRTLLGEKASREIWVCDAGAFVVLKALAFDSRGENKDAYDLHYVVRNYGTGVDDVCTRLGPLLGDAHAQKAVTILRRDFLEHDAVGPRRVAEFLVGAPDDAVQADVVGDMTALLALLDRVSSH